MDAPHGASSSSAYVVRFASLREGLLVLSRHTSGSGSSGTVAFEVLNNTSNPVGGVSWSLSPAPPCDPTDRWCSGNWGQDVLLAPRSRMTLSSDGVPATSAFTVDASISWTRAAFATPTLAVTSTSGTTVKGTWTNRSSSAMCYPTPTRNSYDARGGLLASHEVYLNSDYGWAGHHTFAWTATRVPAPPAGTARTAWTISTAPGPPLGCLPS